MTLEAKATITGDDRGRRLRIYIPVELAVDSAFPFRIGDKIKITIDTKNQRLLINKVLNTK